MPSASVLSLKNSKLLSWLICFAIAGAATFLLYDAAKPQVNLYWFGTILAIAMFATSLGMPIKPVLYSFLYGLDQFFLPYELAPALIMFATGYVRIRYVLVLMTLRMFLVSFAVLITATFLWPMMGM